jgi:hypothetical protein
MVIGDLFQVSERQEREVTMYPNIDRDVND